MASGPLTTTSIELSEPKIAQAPSLEDSTWSASERDDNAHHDELGTVPIAETSLNLDLFNQLFTELSVPETDQASTTRDSS
jgi:hypothetical protein